MECLGYPRDNLSASRADFLAFEPNNPPIEIDTCSDCRITLCATSIFISIFNWHISCNTHSSNSHNLLGQKTGEVALTCGQVLVSGGQRQMLARALFIWKWTAIC